MQILPCLLMLATGATVALSCGSQQPAGTTVGQGADELTSTAQMDTTQLAEYVVGAFVDSKGDLWFGTINNGVAHVANGTISFIDTTDGLPPNGGHGIVEARDGTMWFAGHDGLYTYDARSGGRVVQVLATEARVGTDSKGEIWVSTNTEVHKVKGKNLEPFALPVAERPKEFSIVPGRTTFQFEDSRGNLWFSTDGNGALKYDGKDFTRFTKQDGLCSNTPWEIIEDREGRIWFACVQAYQPAMTNDGGLCVLEKDGTFRTFPDVAGLHHNDLYTLYLDRAGNVWSSAFGTGVYRINAAGPELYNTTNRPDLNGNFGLQDMVQDSNGTLWCGFSGGLFRFDGNGFVNVPRRGPWE